ncbi:hypothetical protein [uncultured Deefgea sp.]|uniref:hypothetical protein n=1 Tax=uncultured Deefgea sp. TaxID=1304914 RepID=UPI00262B7ABB|nr:hypothetical protein [uncultured Deefgea sp.]
MMPKKSLLALIFSAMLANAVLAHGDEDHGSAPVVLSRAGLASAETHSAEFALFAQINQQTLQVYLDRYQDNSPVAGAQIEVESGDFKAQLKPISPGVYSVAAPALSSVGEHALMFTIIAGEQSDLLETTLTVAKPALTPASGPAVSAWWWGAGGLLSIGAISLIIARQRRATRPVLGVKT